MRFGRLLAAGKSLIGMRNGETRYRQNKHVRLPKFISPKNPFIAPERVNDVAPAPTPTPTPTPAVELQQVEPVAVVESARSVTVTELSKPVTAPAPARPRSNWLGGLTGKLNPFQSGRGSKAAQGAAGTQQGELALDRVQVVRNDLTDLDGKIGHAEPKPVAGLPVMSMTMEKFEPVNAAWQRIAAKFIGTDER